MLNFIDNFRQWETEIRKGRGENGDRNGDEDHEIRLFEIRPEKKNHKIYFY